MIGLEATNLGFDRGGARVLDSVNLCARESSALAIVGPNGAGKTTMLSLFAGRFRPSRGRITIYGKDISALDSRAAASTAAYLPQIERLPFNYSVLEFVLMGRAPHVPPLSMPNRRDISASEKALSELGIGGLAERRITELSGGEFQLVRLARCLAQEARLLLLDEPTSLLDPANEAGLSSVLRSLVRAGRTLIFSTHDIALALSLADEAVLLVKGKIAAAGPAADTLRPESLESAFGLRFAMAPIPVPVLPSRI